MLNEPCNALAAMPGTQRVLGKLIIFTVVTEKPIRVQLLLLLGQCFCSITWAPSSEMWVQEVWGGLRICISRICIDACGLQPHYFR